MRYSFATIEEALYLIEMAYEQNARIPHVSPSRLRNTLEDAAMTRGLLYGTPKDFNQLLTWSETVQGADFWSDVHHTLEAWASSLGDADFRDYLIEHCPEASRPEEFPLPTEGIAGWIRSTCIAQTEKLRSSVESTLTACERHLLEDIASASVTRARSFSEWAREAGLWHGSVAEVERALRGSAYVCLQMVVPLPGSNGNGHNYPIGKPVLMIKGRMGLIMGTAGIGNNLCENREQNVRLATLEEIDKFFKRTPRERYMSLFDTHIRPALEREYTVPETPL